MKFIFLFLSSFLLSFGAWSHNYYFGFAEMQYNEINHTLETTIVLSAHDLEDVLMKSKSIDKSLEFLLNDSIANLGVEKFILNSFQVEFDNQKADFHLVGFEISATGMIQIYLLAENVTLIEKLNITFSSMMDVFEAQQNKLTFIQNNNKQTAVFLQNQKSTVIQLKN
jgi:hypothetical protein